MTDNEDEKESSEQKEQHEKLKGKEQNQLAKVCFQYLQSFLSALKTSPRLQDSHCKNKSSEAFCRKV